jgi:hypothetical protein
VAGNYQAAAAVASAALTPYAQHLLMMLFAIELIYTASFRSAKKIVQRSRVAAASLFASAGGSDWV